MTPDVDQLALDQAALDREKIRRGGFYEFVKRAWHLVEPGVFKDNWHIGLICERLDACFDRQVKKIIFNVPPGFMKSLTCSILFHPYCWTLAPDERFFYACFDQALSNVQATKARNLVTSDWYQLRWPTAMPRDIARATQFYENGAGGWRFSTSIPKGKGTGRHPHQRWFDDPIKPLETQGSAKNATRALQACITWYKGTISTRQADPETTVTGLIMQRLHDGDLAGALKAEWGDEVEHVCLPMHYDPERAYSYSAIINS